MIHFGFTKSADLALMRGFAQALAATGVTINAVLCQEASEVVAFLCSREASTITGSPVRADRGVVLSIS